MCIHICNTYVYVYVCIYIHIYMKRKSSEKLNKTSQKEEIQGSNEHLKITQLIIRQMQIKITM